MTASAGLAADLDQLISGAQRAHRHPSVSAAAARSGQVLWTGTIGTTPDSQYRIGSITKTFTAAATLTLSDEGLIDIDDRLDVYVPGTPFGRVTLRHLLCHVGGLPREAATPMWRTFNGPDRTEFMSALKDSEPIAAAGSRWHYSNLGYALLGEVMARATGSDGREVIEERLLRPLDLARTSWDAKPPADRGYRVDPYEDALHTEPEMDQGAVGVGGQLWSTTGDLLTWAQALLGERPDVLPRHVVDAMHTLHTMANPEQWEQGWGLGLILTRQGGGILAGHTGAMPGFSSSLLLHRPSGVATIVLINATRADGLDELATAIVGRVIDEPVTEVISRWEPGPACPDDLASILGSWWSESDEIVFTWNSGKLRAHLQRDPNQVSVFEEEKPDILRVSEGRWYGERLRIDRDERGQLASFEWATYPFTRWPS